LSPAVEAEIKNHLLKCDDCRVVQEAATTTLDREFGTYKASEHRQHLRTVIQAA